MSPKAAMSESDRPNNKAERDAAWLSGLRDNDFDSFREIFEHYAPVLINFGRLSVPREVAEDIVQDVMFNLWQRRATIVMRTSLGAYLFGAVKNRIANWIRHEKVVHRAEQTSSAMHPPGMGQSPPRPDTAVLKADLSSALKGALQQLSAIQRETIVMRWEEGMTYEEISTALSISISAAKQHGSRAQRIIRSLLADFARQEDQ